MSANSNGLLFAQLKTDTAFDAFCLINDMGPFFLADYGSGTAFSDTETAAVAALRINFIVKKRGAYTGVTFSVCYVPIKFVCKISQSGLYRVWGRLP